MTDPAVERFLEEQYASLADATPSAYADGAHESALTLISALVDLNLLRPGDGEEWNARFARASEDPLERPLAPPDLRRKAHEYLKRCLAEIAAEGEQGSTRHWHVYGALEAFVEVGLLSGQDFERWQGRLWYREPVESGGHDSADAASRFDMTHLLRVVPGPDERVGGIGVTAVALYADGVAVQWHRAPDVHTRQVWRALSPRGARSRNLSLDDPPVRLADELGTAYVCRGSGSTNGSMRRHGELGHTDFVPAVPTQVRQLRVEIGDQTLEIPL